MCVYLISDSDSSILDLSIEDEEVVFGTDHIDLSVVDLNERVSHQHEVVLGAGDPQWLDDVTIVTNGRVKNGPLSHLAGGVEHKQLTVL